MDALRMAATVPEKEAILLLVTECQGAIRVQKNAVLGLPGEHTRQSPEYVLDQNRGLETVCPDYPDTQVGLT